MQWKDFLLIPNLLTLGRVILLIPGIFYLHLDNNILAFIILGIVFLSDFLDGWIARKFHQTSLLGAILDPVADKLVVLSLFGYFFIMGNVPIIYFSLILIRDISQLSSVPILLFWKKISFQVKPKLIPKWGTAMNFIILALLGLEKVYNLEIYFNYSKQFMIAIYFVSGIIEAYILITFIPRFYQIYNGQHDTFE